MSISTKHNSQAVGSSSGGEHSVDKSDCFPRPLTLRQVQAVYGISYWVVRGWVIDGLLHPVRLTGSRIKAKGGRVIANSRDH